MGLEDRDWYREAIRKNPKKYGLPQEWYNPKEFRRDRSKRLEQKPGFKKPLSQIWIWAFWIALVCGLFLVFKQFEKKPKTQPLPPVPLQSLPSKPRV